MPNLLKTQSGRGHFQLENKGLNVNGVLQEIIFHIRAEAPVRLPRHSKMCWLITLGMTEAVIWQLGMTYNGILIN